MDSRLEERYVVLKIKNLTEEELESVRQYQHAQVDCVVIEEDWPEYDATVNLLWERINGV